MTNKKTEQLVALVVEDERDYAELLAAVLKGGGYSVEYAVDGIDALKRVRERRPDVITLDVQMPRKGGIQFYRELKSDPEFVGIPVVVVTGITSPHFSPSFVARPARCRAQWSFRPEGRGVVLDSPSSIPMRENAAGCGASPAAAGSW